MPSPSSHPLSEASAGPDTYVCYILDGILFAYGIVLTVLYCRLKMGSGSNLGHSQKKPEEEHLHWIDPSRPGHL
ncbi:hypothetical protein ANANG_G00319040 [Anguilla anguilla]|uniref:Uncharacterized protein n=1 Tax=Anguilla anguilla TaxID=7936 RepID=A0A9D3LHP3_ANGAN|nr:hypothetical protein ANANG_G00319040 [Anguilla anguilla]